MPRVRYNFNKLAIVRLVVFNQSWRSCEIDGARNLCIVRHVSRISFVRFVVRSSFDFFRSGIIIRCNAEDLTYRKINVRSFLHYRLIREILRYRNERISIECVKSFAKDWTRRVATSVYSSEAYFNDSHDIGDFSVKVNIAKRKKKRRLTGSKERWQSAERRNCREGKAVGSGIPAILLRFILVESIFSMLPTIPMRETCFPVRPNYHVQHDVTTTNC